MIPRIDFLFTLLQNLMNAVTRLNFIQAQNQNQGHPINDLDIPPLPDLLNMLKIVFSLLKLVHSRRQEITRRNKMHNVIKLLQEYRFEILLIFLFKIYILFLFLWNIPKFVFVFNRVTTEHHDMWEQLQNNWNHFFWLTGEIPPTFTKLVERIQQLVTVHRRGRKLILDLKNQVHPNFQSYLQLVLS